MPNTNPNEYRYRCPAGHVTVRKISTARGKYTGCEVPAYYCNTCKKTYQGKPIDTRIDPDDEDESWEAVYINNKIEID